MLTYFTNNARANCTAILIHIFRTNIFINSLLLLLYTVLVRIYGIVYPTTPVTDSVTNGVQEWVLTGLDSSRAYAIVACLLVYLQGLIINRLIIKNRIGHELSLLPGMFYILGVSILPEHLQIHLTLIATLFILVGITRLFNSYKEHNAATLVFDVGFYFGIASIFQPSASLFFILGYVGLVILRAVKTKDRLQYIAGIVVPYFLWFSISFWLDGESEVWSYLRELVSYSIPQVQGWRSIYVTAACVVLSFIAILGYGANISKKAIQVQKKVDILYWVLLFSGLVIFHTGVSYSITTLLMVPLAFFITQLVLRLKGLLVAEVIHVVVVISVLLFHFGLLSF